MWGVELEAFIISLPEQIIFCSLWMLSLFILLHGRKEQNDYLASEIKISLYLEVAS